MTDYCLWKLDSNRIDDLILLRGLNFVAKRTYFAHILARIEVSPFQPTSFRQVITPVQKSWMRKAALVSERSKVCQTLSRPAGSSILTVPLANRRLRYCFAWIFLFRQTTDRLVVQTNPIRRGRGSDRHYGRVQRPLPSVTVSLSESLS